MYRWSVDGGYKKEGDLEGSDTAVTPLVDRSEIRPPTAAAGRLSTGNTRSTMVRQEAEQKHPR
jgi:hypothetical protein